MELILERPSSDSGFGFSVSWLRPPRIERVEAGKPAFAAGLEVGDRVLGVGGEIMEENVDIYHGIKGAGLKLKLTIDRERPRPPPTPWNKIHVRQELLSSLSDTQKRLFSAQLRFFKQTVSALDRYLIPAGKSGLMSQQEMKAIFGGVIGIITVMARLLHCVNRGDCGLEDANLDHLPELSTAYSEYASGLPTSSKTLSAKMGEPKFTQFILNTQTPYDLTYVLFSPLYHLRQVLQLTTGSLNAQILQMYTKITTEHHIIEPTSSPLVTVQELESRLVSTTIKPAKLTRWLFGSRLEVRDGSSWCNVFGFLFTDLLLIVTQPTRDRLFFVKQQVWLKELASLHFSSGGDLDFKLVYNQVKRFKLLRSEKAVHLRVAGVGLKAMWKLLLQKQIIELNTVGFPSSSSAFSLSEFTEKFPEDKRVVNAPETIQEEEAAEDLVNNNQHDEIKIRVDKPVPDPTPPVKPARVPKDAKAKAKEAREKEMQKSEPEPKQEPEPKSEPTKPQAPAQVPTPMPRQMIKEQHHQRSNSTSVPVAESQHTNHQQAPVPAPRTIMSSSYTAGSSAPQPKPIPRPRSYQDSPAPQHRTYCDYDRRVQRDYPELFGITPRDRRMFIKAIGDRPTVTRGSVSAGATPAMGVRGPFAATIASYSVSTYSGSPVISKPRATTQARVDVDLDVDGDVEVDVRGTTERGGSLGPYPPCPGPGPLPKVDRNFMRLRSAQLRAALAPQPPHVPTSPELSSNDSGISDETTGAAINSLDHPNQNHVDAEVRHLPLDDFPLAPSFSHAHYFSNHNTQLNFDTFKGTATTMRGSRQCQRQGLCGVDCMVDHINHNQHHSHNSNSRSTTNSSHSSHSYSHHSTAPQLQSHQPLIVKIVSPVRMSIVRHHNMNSSTHCTAVLENIDSTDGSTEEECSGCGSGSGSGSGSRSVGESSQSDDVASASPVLGGGTTEPSWSSEEDLLDRDRLAPPVPPVVTSAPVPTTSAHAAGTSSSHHSRASSSNPIANFYKLTDLSDGDSDGDIDVDADDETATLSRYESYEALDRITALPRSTACFGLADADKDEEFDERRLGVDLEDRYDYLSDEEEDAFDYPDQIEDNTYSVSRLGPLPPVLEEEFEEDEEAFMMQEDEEEDFPSTSSMRTHQQPSPSTSTRSRNSSSYNFTVARIAGLYARTSISPLRILRDLWLRRRLRERKET